MLVNIILKSKNLKRINLSRGFSLTHECLTGQPDEFLKNYTNLIENKLLRVDDHQLKSVKFLNQFYNQILTYECQPCQTRTNTATVSLFDLFKRQKKQTDEIIPNLKGIYLYGGVGCGKTMLMDMFYDLVPNDKKKLRMHFNKFMQDIHRRIHTIKQDPHLTKSDEAFNILAEQLSDEIHIIFFDEFQVTDIADAMLMKRLFTALFKNGIILFSTSNRVPTDLYMNGLQRALFLPFIDVLEQFCHVVCLDSPNDYRRISHQSKDKIYFHSDYENYLVDELVSDMVKTQDGINLTNDRVNCLHKLQPRTIQILGRQVKFNRSYKRLLDTDFKYMCEEARSAADYLKLAELYDIIVLRDIPHDMSDVNSLRRFIIFIDTIYDHKLRLICSGKASCIQMLFNENMSQLMARHNYTKPVSHLDSTHLKVYKDSQVNKRASSLFTLDEEIFAIERTVSRLIDMQSEKYIEASKKLIEKNHEQFNKAS